MKKLILLIITIINISILYSQNLSEKDFAKDNSLKTPFKDVEYHYDTIQPTICQNEIYIYNNIIFVYDTVFNDTIQSIVSSVDTIRTIQLQVNPIYDTILNVSICNGGSYEINNNIYTNEGTFVERMSSQYGCDSIVTLNLSFINQTYDDTIIIYGCNEGYHDDNFQIENDGIYSQKLTSIYGCDSLVTIDFTRIEPFVDSIFVEIYKGDTFTDFGFSNAESGIFEQTFQDIYGCDSIYILNLKVVDLKFPTAITPNGDGINDIFEINDLIEQTYFQNTKLIIYNRYGKRIFEKENIRNKEDFWNPVQTNTPSGTYFFRFIATGNNKNIDFIGSVEVLR